MEHFFHIQYIFTTSRKYYKKNHMKSAFTETQFFAGNQQCLKIVVAVVNVE